MHGLDEGIVLRHVEEDNGLGMGAERGVREGAGAEKDDGNADHDEAEDAGELGGILHGGLDGDDETDAFEGEDGGADEERPGTAVELHDVGGPVVRYQGREVVIVEIDKSKDNQCVSNKYEFLEIMDLPDERDGHEEEHLAKNEPADINVPLTFGDGKEERLEIFRDKNDVGGDETDLTYYQRKVDHVFKPGAVEVFSHLTKRLPNDQPGASEQAEAVIAETRDGKKDDIAEHHPTVVKRAREEKDASADKGLQQHHRSSTCSHVTGRSFLFSALPLARSQERAVFAIFSFITVISIACLGVIISIGREVLIRAQDLVIFREYFSGKMSVQAEELQEIIGDKLRPLTDFWYYDRLLRGSLLRFCGIVCCPSEIVSAEALRLLDAPDVEFFILWRHPAKVQAFAPLRRARS